MNHFLLFLIFSIPVVLVSFKSLKNLKSHGFYRFFSWECILWLFVHTYSVWFKEPVSLLQLLSWLLLTVSAVFVISGVIVMKRIGNAGKKRTDDTLYGFEKTTQLIDKGIFHYIRHPLYSSLLLLTWGITLKNPTLELCIVALISSVFLYLTAIHDEKECTVYFGESYVDYMKRSKRFIPFII
jgi:protein-S-isoprenylcysteine O-methyltransferase Ste14